jgi:acyl carrier protein
MSTVSSRTPEGWPNRCFICGADFFLEPSTTTDDAPCPQCGQLVWWFRDRLQVEAFLSEFDLDRPIADLESLDVVELVMMLEEDWNITMSGEDFAKYRTIRDLLRELRRRQSEETNDL